MQPVNTGNPTADLTIDFAAYVLARQQEASAHLVGGVPDYAFAMDCKLRQQLAGLTPLRKVAEAVVSVAIPWERQQRLLTSVAVGPNQFPRIFAIAEDCARRLGIGVPAVFIKNGGDANAYTIATDQATPVVVLTSSIAQGSTEAELRFVIGHECGHVHNLHGLYNTMVQLLTNPTLAGLDSLAIMPGWVLALLRGGLLAFLTRWSRFAEVTSDRAGLICCGDRDAAELALAKLAVGGTGGMLGELNIDQLVAQLDQIEKMPVRVLEIGQTHPSAPRRIAALRQFAGSQVLASWRPDMPIDAPIDKAELDKSCETIIRVASVI